MGELKRALAKELQRPAEIKQVYQLIDQGQLDPVVALLSGSERILLVVDHFEEIFTVCGEEPDQEEKRRKFIELLTQFQDALLQ